MPVVCNKKVANVDPSITGPYVDDKSHDLKYQNNVSTTTERHCPKDFRSCKILVQHLSEKIGYSLFTNTFFQPNDVLFECIIPFSELRRSPDMHTIQVTKDLHWSTKNHPIQFTQHSCFNINSKFVLGNVKVPEDSILIGADGIKSKFNEDNKQEDAFATFSLVALQDLNPGMVIAVNYNSFEWDMSCSFVDDEAPSDIINTGNGNQTVKDIASIAEKSRRGTFRKGREVRGFRYAMPDEKKFLIDQGLLFKHIENAFSANNGLIANETQCSNNFRSSKILVQHLSEEIGYSLFTNSFFKPNDVLFECSIPMSEIKSSPDMHTIQVAKDWHWCTKKHPIQFTQHSCFNINCKFVLEDLNDKEVSIVEGNNDVTNKLHESTNHKGKFANFKLIALKDIKPQTVITVNYNSFEWEMSCSFMDEDAPSQAISSKNTKTSNENVVSQINKGENGVSRKARDVRGFKYAMPDEQTFLMDHGLLFKHIHDSFKSIKQK